MHSGDNNTENLKHRYQNILNTLSKCKMAYKKERDEAKKLSETNSKLQDEVKQFRDREKSFVNPLLTSREMINNLQDTVSQLVYLKSDIKKLQDEVTAKENTIAALQKERENLISKHNDGIEEIEITYKQKMEEVDAQHEEQIMQIQQDNDTQLAQFTCLVEELRDKIKNMESEHRDKMNVVVLEYEEKLQKSAAEITRLKDQQLTLVARADANVEAYRKRLEEVEEKLKHNQFKQFLAQNSTSLYESPVERPYSTTREYTYDSDRSNVPQPTKPTHVSTIKNVQKTTVKTPKPLPINYYDNNFYNPSKQSDKKGAFTIIKKRKLFNEKDILD